MSFKRTTYVNRKIVGNLKRANTAQGYCMLITQTNYAEQFQTQARRENRDKLSQ